MTDHISKEKIAVTSLETDKTGDSETTWTNTGTKSTAKGEGGKFKAKDKATFRSTKTRVL